MNPERWQQIDKLLDEALDQEPGQRKIFLEQACAGDEELRREVEVLLEAHDKAGSFVERPALDLVAQQPRQSLVGRKFGPYEILSLLGRGGMGEVYQARDTRLDRINALKILPVEVASDPDRLRRFVREAKAASALNHPNIATIYDIGESDGVHWIAMELVEGQTLAERMKDRPLAMDEILDIGIQTAEALEAAHKKGIIHRDIKPANLMLTPEGRVKILDFGLAKRTQWEGQPAAAAVSSETHTFPGMIMGTARYMSPEQVLGQPADHRTDIFSLGVLLYEMAAGQPPFAGETPSAIFDAIVHQTPAWPPRVQARIPEELRRIIQRALEKFREMRYQTASDLSADLKQLKRETYYILVSSAAEAVEGPGKSVDKQHAPKRRKWTIAAALIIILAGSWIYVRFFHHDVPLPPPKILPVTTFPGSADQPSISSDGRWIAFTWNGEKQDNWDIYVKETDGTGFNRLTTDPAEDCCAAWSSDGRQIAFLRKTGDRAALYLTSPLGGGEQKLIDLGWWYFSSLSWSPDGKNILFVDRKTTGEPWSIWSLALDTLEKRQLVEPVVGSLGDFFPAYSPDGRYIAFARAFQIVISAIYVKRLPVGEPKMVTGFNNPLFLCWTQDGREIIFSIHRQTGETGLWRIAINDGEPRRIPVRGQFIDSPSVGRNRLVYSSRTSRKDIWSLALTGSGVLKPLSKQLISWTSNEDNPDISPKGDKVAFCSDRSGYSEIWVCARDCTKPVQLTDMRAKNTGSPRWSPDGKKIAFDSTKSGNTDIYVVDSDSGPVRRMTNDLTEEAVPRWSNDGRWIYFGSNRGGSYQVWKMPSEGGKAI